MESSRFNPIEQPFPDAEPLSIAGSTCECYRVRLYGKLHFLKRLRPEFRTSPRHVAALRKEFETGYTLSHQGLVGYASLTPDGILMDYVDGQTLREFVRDNPEYLHQRSNADRFLQQLLDVVGYLHAHQVVHLDLKPENILITRIGHYVKIIDLGYCLTDTYADTPGRTDRYAAPEQFTGKALDVRTDIYAIGQILQELPCADMYRKIAERCTADDPKERFQSTDEIVRAMHRRKPVAMWVAGSLLLAVLVVGALWWTLHTQQASTSPVTSADSATTTTLGDTVLQSSVAARPMAGDLMKPNDYMPTAEKTVGATTETTKTQSYDTLRLRREIQAVLTPLFEKQMGSYRSIDYDQMTPADLERFSHAGIAFRKSTFPLLNDFRQKHADRYPSVLIGEEWYETEKMLEVTLLWQMKRNNPNHDPIYDKKTYRYYGDASN